MALLEVKPSGHWSTHSPPYNKYPDAQVKQLVTNVFLSLRKKRKKKKRRKSYKKYKLNK